MNYAIQTHQNGFRTKTQSFGRGGVIFRSNTGIDDATLAQVAPSVFAEQAHGSRSDRYTYIPTSEVLKGLRAEGFAPFEVRQGGSKDMVKRAFTKHLIRFRHESTALDGDSMREIVMLNAHDGTSSYQMMSGVFRTICANGLIVCEGETQTVRIPHKGDIVGNVIDAAFTIIDQGSEINRRVNDMRLLELKPAEQEAFAEAALALRFDGEAGAPVSPMMVNSPRRGADQGADLWRTFNRVQENLIRGGLDYRTRADDGRIRHNSTRAVNSIDGDTSLNKALWTLARKMQELKAA